MQELLSESEEKTIGSPLPGCGLPDNFQRYLGCFERPPKTIDS